VNAIARRHPRRPGFTLIELIAVVTLILVVLGIAVPAFTGMINASERSLAENTLRVGVTVARDIAVLNGRDSGLLFVREANGRTRLIPVIKVGELEDAVENPFVTAFTPGVSQTITRDVYAPVPFSSPLQMPRGWAIAGYAEPGTIDQFVGPTPTPGLTEGWYDSFAYGDQGQTTQTPDPVRDAGHWLLPETAVFERFMQAPGDGPPSGFNSQVSGVDADRTPRQSVMLRFSRTTGALVRGGRPAIVLDPRASSLGRGLFTGPSRWMRANRVEDYEPWVERILATDDLDGGGTIDAVDTRYLIATIGNFSNDTVLAGAVSRIALFEERDLLSGLGASGPNRDTGWLYEPIEEAQRIAFDMDLFAGSPVITGPEDVRLGITRWIQGDTNFLAMETFESDGDGDPAMNVYGDAEAGGNPADAPLARIYFVHPGTGELTEVQR
jgi:prepilin-type N-terminal cleavage/methylation domain-containing protein